jgi:hypothetical protein
MQLLELCKNKDSIKPTRYKQIEMEAKKAVVFTYFCTTLLESEETEAYGIGIAIC